MKFKLIIDKEKDEEVVVTAHQRTALIDEIEALLSKHTDRIPGYTEDDIKFTDQLQCIVCHEWINAADSYRILKEDDLDFDVNTEDSGEWL